MKILKFPFFGLGFVALLLSSLTGVAVEEENGFRVLVFSKTAGFRHGSIEVGIEAIQKIGEGNHFEVEATEDSTVFNSENLGRFQAVVFLNTTGTVFNGDQRQAFQEFIRSGGGFVGVHSASDTEYDWEWYGKLVGAYFKSHPRTQEAVIEVEEQGHPATSHLSPKWKRVDEWYNFRSNPRADVHVLLSLDTGSFEGSGMMDDHPIAWFHYFDGGRAFYTALGHTTESYAEEAFKAHLLGAIRWAAGTAESGTRGTKKVSH